MSIVAIAVIGVLFAIAYMRPLWALALVMTMFPMEQCLQANASFFISQSKVVNLAVAGAVIMAIIRLSMKGQLVMRRWMNVVAVSSILLYSWAALSYFWTFSPEWLAEYIRLGTPYLLLMMVTGPLILSRLSQVSELRIAVMLIGTIIATLLIINPNFQLYGGRYVFALDAATYTNPLVIGSLGGLLVLASVLSPSSTGKRAELLLRVAAFVIGLGLATLSGSRGQVLFAILCAILFYPVSRRMKNWSNFVGLLAGVFIFAVGVIIVRKLFVGIENEERWSSESLVFGGEGRLENVMDLADAYLKRPLYWATGLGCLAFHDLPTTSGDPYSHVLIADVVFELGIPGIIFLAIIVLTTTQSAFKMFAIVANKPQERADMTWLVAYAMYEFMLANKAGQLWGLASTFMGCCMIARLRYLAEDQVAIEATEMDEYAQESFDDAIDDRISGQLVIS